MIVICEECGKKYRFDPSMIKNEVARFKCKACSYILTIRKPKAPAPPVVEQPKLDLIDAIPVEEAASVEARPAALSSEVESIAGAGGITKTKGLGLRTKMIVLFMVVPLLAFGAVGMFLLYRMNHLAGVMTREATQSVSQSGEELIRSIARSAANQSRQYLLANPGLTEADFMKDANFRKIAVQRVGLTGYTALYSVNPMTLLAHPNRRLVGKPLTETVKNHLGEEIDRWRSIVNDIDQGENVERAGYYLWIDPDGVLREKFMVVTPLKGTKYGITSTVYMEEFLRPIKKVENEAARITISARNYFIYSLVGVLLMIGLIVSVYSYRLTSKINALTAHAERISYGDLDARLTLNARDELGSLNQAINLMQNSIRVAIQRLRKRR